ncbi:MAG: hypothetical protein AAGG11_23680 [Pseudomonadota bacterium]
MIQSHRTPLPADWLTTCIDSVRRWAATADLDYRWLGDELFAPVPTALLAKTRTQPVVATDLARLYQLECALAEGFDPVVWLDADVLIFRPDAFALPATGHCFGREYWLQADADGRVRSYRRIHNALLMFRAGDPVLPFYRFTAERILRTFRSEQMVPQLLGPKLVSALGSIAQFEVQESIGMVSPLVREGLVNQDRALLERWAEGHGAPLAAVNLCASLSANSPSVAVAIDRLLQPTTG